MLLSDTVCLQERTMEVPSSVEREKERDTTKENLDQPRGKLTIDERYTFY